MKEIRTSLVIMMTIVVGIVSFIIGVMGVGHSAPKDDDLYVPPASVPDDQNVVVALGEIVGYGDDDETGLLGRIEKASPGFGPRWSDIFSTLKDWEGRMVYYDYHDFDFEDDDTIAIASNRVEFLALVDALIATNECVATAIANASKRPHYVNRIAQKKSADMDSPSKGPNDLNLMDLLSVARNLYGARHVRFMEEKQYANSLEDGRILLELADKMIHGQSGILDKLIGMEMHNIVSERFVEIIKQEDVGEDMLANIDALLSRYDLTDWRKIGRSMVRGEYSHYRDFIFDVFNSKLLRNKWWGCCLRGIFHPNRTLSKRVTRSRDLLSLLDDYDALVADAEEKHKKDAFNMFQVWLMRILPDYVTELCFLSSMDIGKYLADIPNVISNDRACRLLVGCRRHKLRTGKWPETVNGVAGEILTKPITDPVFNTPYEIKTWHEGDFVHVAVFRKDTSGAIVPSKDVTGDHLTYNSDYLTYNSPGKGCLVHVCCPIDSAALDGAKNASGEVRHYKQDLKDYYTFFTNGVEWAYEIVNDGEVRLGYREKCGKAYWGRRHGAIAGMVPKGIVKVPSEICGRKVVGIDAVAFAGCKELTGIAIPDSVASIGWAAFSDCENLVEVYCAGSPDCDSGEPIFAGCRSLKEITVFGNCATNALEERAYRDCPSLADANGFSVCHGKLVKYFGKGGEIVVPYGVWTIADGAFLDPAATNLTSITIPDSVTNIGFYPFAGCKNLKWISCLGDMPKSVTDKKGRLAWFERGTYKDIKGNFTIKARKDSRGWGLKARMFGTWNGFKIELE